MNDSPIPGSSLDSSEEQSSLGGATIHSPTDSSPDVPLQQSSSVDATIDAPPEVQQDSTPLPDSHTDVTMDAPPEPPVDSSLTIDHLPTHEGDSDGSDSAAFSLAEDTPKVKTPAKNVVANYEILGILGRGAVGVVYKARQVGLNRLVALKMLLSGSHAGQRELMRFRIEAEAVARLRHPNIVQVYEVGEHNGLPFFSLEFVEGGSLSQKLGGKPLPPREAARIMEALCRAMYYAHQQNIIHRDLKPANVLLTPDGTPKITDFGLAKRLEEAEESSQTRTGTLMGTPSYMSPEQAEGRTHAIGPVSDQYTLGAILYELLTGRPPFLGATMLDTIHQVRKQEPVPPTQLQATTPHDLEVICLKGLQKEPGKRYPHAGEMADDLKRFLKGEPIRARPVSLLERSWRWCRRNPRVASLYSVVAVLMLLLAVSGCVLGVRSFREQQAADRVQVQAEQLMEQAEKAIAGGDVRRAKDLLERPDSLLVSTTELNEPYSRWMSLRNNIKTYESFKDLLDKVRFAYIFGGRSSRKEMEEGKEYARQLLTMYDAIEQGKAPLPLLSAEQEQLLKEDVFDMFLLAGLIESELAQNASIDRRHQAAQQALDWLDRADKILPGMKTLYAHRSGYHGTLGHREADEQEKKRANAAQPNSAVDHFWHGYAEHVRGDGDNSRGNADKAREHYRKEIAEYAALLRQHPDHFWGYFDWAVAKIQLGDLEDALIGFTNCIRLRPDFSWSYLNRGTVHLRLRQYDQAIRDYDEALKYNPEDLQARTNRALAYVEQGNLDQALEDCNLVLEKDPRFAAAYLHRAECYLRHKQYEDALADCTSVLKLNEYKEDVHLKRAAIYEAMKRSGEESRSKSAKAQDQKTALEFFKAAQQYESRGEYTQALANYNATIELFPNGVEPYQHRAILNWLRLKDFDAALVDFRQVSRFWSKKSEPYRFLAMIHMGLRQYDLALKELDEALSKKPGDPDALWAKAQIYLWQGKAQEALDVVNPMVQKLSAETADTFTVRGDIYCRMGRLDEAAADYRRYIPLKPNDPDAYVSLAYVYRKKGEPAKARQCLDQLVQANPKLMVAYLQRGRFLRDQGQFEEAWKDSEEAARCDAKSALPALLQASITAARGDAAAAVAAAERVLSEAPKDDGQVLYSAVQVWGLASAASKKAGDAESAQRYAERAVELLNQTLDKGFHDLSYPEHDRMIDDPALESIRQNPQAQDLLAHRSQ